MSNNNNSGSGHRRTTSGDAAAAAAAPPGAGGLLQRALAGAAAGAAPDPQREPLLQRQRSSGPNAAAAAAAAAARPRSTGRVRMAAAPALPRGVPVTIATAAAINQAPAPGRQRDAGRFVPLSTPQQQQQQQRQPPFPPLPPPPLEKAPLLVAPDDAGAPPEGSSPPTASDAAAFLPGQAPVGWAPPPSAAPPVTIFEGLDEDDGPSTKGRITAMTVAEGLDRRRVEALLRARYPNLELATYQDVLHATPRLDDHRTGDVFFFDYGTVVFWGISAADEQALVLSVVNPSKLEPLGLSEVEIDEFTYHYSATQPPHIQNDTITINRAFAADHAVKLAISHALAQSTLLGCYEERLQDIVEQTKDLPEALALKGRVAVSRKQVARLIGQVFLQRSAVNLLGVVLDTPEYFWSAPDHLQVLYKRVCEYLELDTRVEVLNTRYGVLQEMLEMLRDHLNNAHMAKLEWIVVYLIVAAVVIGLLQVAGLIGFIKPGDHH